MRPEQESTSSHGEMIRDSRLLIVGGSGRNVGKTEFLCRLIRKISSERAVYGLKVSAVFPNEARYHGDHTAEPPEGSLFEETRQDTRKDTSRMLRSGACRVFYLRGEDENILDGFIEFRKRIPHNAVVICESNSLVHYVKPALFVLVKAAQGPLKTRARALLSRADLIIDSDGKSGFPELDRIGLNRVNAWILTDQE